MGKGRDRNAPCWCGSGRKYKKCHLDRDRESRLPPWKADQGLRECYGVRRCIVPEGLRDACSGNIVRAHTVPKSGSLRHIARDGHVYAFVPSIKNISRSKGTLAPEPVGVNRASTFTGFCAHHDKQLFAPIEDKSIDFNLEQVFLLGYRAMARELFLKEAQLEATGLLRDADRGHDLDDQVAIQQYVALHNIGVNTGVKDALRHKEFYDHVLQSGDYSDVRGYVMTFRTIPPVMCSGGLFPYECFNGAKAQDFPDLGRPADAIYYTSFAAGDVGAVVFTWLPDSKETCDKFIRSLERVSDEQLSGALVRFFFEYCENVQIAPEWWDKLSQVTRDAFVNRLSAAANPLVERRENCLADDGLEFDDWTIQMRFRVGPT